MTVRQKAGAPTGIGPADFAPHLDETRDCYCPTHMARAYSLSLNSGSEKRLQGETAEALLAELKAGTHVRRERAEYIAEQRAAADPRYPRGYVRQPMIDLREPGFRSHCGVGFGSLK